MGANERPDKPLERTIIAQYAALFQIHLARSDSQEIKNQYQTHDQQTTRLNPDKTRTKSGQKDEIKQNNTIPSVIEQPLKIDSKKVYSEIPLGTSKVMLCSPNEL